MKNCRRSSHTHHDKINTQPIILQSVWNINAASSSSIAYFYRRPHQYIYHRPLKIGNRLAIAEKGARPRAHHLLMHHPMNSCQSTMISPPYELTHTPPAHQTSLWTLLILAVTWWRRYEPRTLLTTTICASADDTKWWYSTVHLLDIHCNGHIFQYPWVYRHSMSLERRWQRVHGLWRWFDNPIAILPHNTWIFIPINKEVIRR